MDADESTDAVESLREFEEFVPCTSDISNVSIIGGSCKEICDMDEKTIKIENNDNHSEMMNPDNFSQVSNESRVFSACEQRLGFDRNNTIEASAETELRSPKNEEGNDSMLFGIKIDDAEENLENKMITTERSIFQLKHENHSNEHRPDSHTEANFTVKLSENSEFQDENKDSKNFHNIEIEIARIVGEELIQDDEVCSEDKASDLFNTVDQKLTQNLDSDRQNLHPKHVESSDGKTSEEASTVFPTHDIGSQESEKHKMLNSDSNSDDEEHENSIDEEEIEDYEMFLLNSSIESDDQIQSETKVHQTEILLSELEDSYGDELKKKCKVEVSDADDDNQYDITQLAEVREVETLHRCQICQYITPHISSLRRHISLTHSKNPWTCKYCRKKFTSRFFGEKHIQAEHSRKNRKCPYCSLFTLCSTTAMQKHISLVHGYKTRDNVRPRILKRDSLREFMKCDHCAFSDKNREVMQVHIRMHSLEFVLKCLHCFYMINNRKMYDEHVRSTHKLAKKIFICTKCFFQSEEWELYYDHINTPHNFHSCSKCEFKSPYIEIFYNHINSHENDDETSEDDGENLVCGKCGYRACSRDNLICHLDAQHTENCGNDQMKDIERGEPFSKIGMKPIFCNNGNENIIEIVEIDETEENGLGIRCKQKPPNHGDPSNDRRKSFEKIGFEESEVMLNEYGITHDLDHCEKKTHDTGHRDSLDCSKVQRISGSEGHPCHEDHQENGLENCRLQSEIDCLKRSLPSKIANVSEVVSSNGTYSSESEYENVERSSCSPLSETIDLVANVENARIHTRQIRHPSYCYPIHEASGGNSSHGNELCSDEKVFEFNRSINVLEVASDTTNKSESNSAERNNSNSIVDDQYRYSKCTIFSSIHDEVVQNMPEKHNAPEDLNKKPKEIIKILKHQCFDCLMIYKTRYTLLDHRKRKHGLRKPHSCTYCMEIFETYNGLKSHYYRIHRVSYHNNGAFYKCPVCDFTSVRKKQTKKHVSRQHNR